MEKIFYEPFGNECELFEKAWKNNLPLLIKGPTGCGKTRFVSYMSNQLNLPLYTIACHDDILLQVGKELFEQIDSMRKKRLEDRDRKDISQS